MDARTAYTTLTGHLPVGTQVQIFRSAASYECGWADTWNPRMDATVGKVGEVIKEDVGRGYKVKVHSNGKWEEWVYPWFVLAEYKLRV